MRPERACAGESALYFIEDKDRTHVVAAASEGLEECGRGDIDASFALDGLDYYAACFLCDE